MKIPSLMTSIKNILVFLRSYLKTNICIVQTGTEIMLVDFTHNRTVIRESFDNGGLERFVFAMTSFKQHLYKLWAAQHGHFDVEEHRKSIDYVLSRYGFIPKL